VPRLVDASPAVQRQEPAGESRTSPDGSAVTLDRRRGRHSSCDKAERFAWWCSLAGALVGAGACIAILAGNLAHAAVGKAPVLAWAPLNIILVAVAFGLAAIVADGVPSLVDGDASSTFRNRPGHVEATAPSVIARCALCSSVFVAGVAVPASGPSSVARGVNLVPSAN
jgi:hypothetical protein